MIRKFWKRISGIMMTAANDKKFQAIIDRTTARLKKLRDEQKAKATKLKALADQSKGIDEARKRLKDI